MAARDSTTTPIDPELSGALTSAARARDFTELAAALRNLAAAAERLAGALEAEHDPDAV
jgi:hypothetical protein